MKLIILAIFTMALTGCASVNQMYSAYGASALVGAQGAEDNVIRTWATAACATPYSAIVRNPSIAPALQSLCIPNGSQASPLSLLDAVPAKKP